MSINKLPLIVLICLTSQTFVAAWKCAQWHLVLHEVVQQVLTDRQLADLLIMDRVPTGPEKS